MQILSRVCVRLIIRCSRFLINENKKEKTFLPSPSVLKVTFSGHGPVMVLFKLSLYTLSGDGINHLATTDIKRSILEEFLSLSISLNLLKTNC